MSTTIQTRDSGPPSSGAASEPKTPAAGLLRQDLGLALLSAAVLTLEVLQTRIFAFSLDAVSLYLAVGVCLLGLGAGATWVAVWPPRADARRAATVGVLLGAAAIFPVHLVFAASSHLVLVGAPQGVLALVALALPYLGFGVAIAALLVMRGGGVGRAYAANLIGSGAGCLWVFPLLDGLGANGALAAVSVISAGAALLLARRALLVTLAAGVVVAGSLLALPSLRFQPDRVDALAAVRRVAERLQADAPPGRRLELVPVFERWDRTGRIDVQKLRTNAPRFIPRVGKRLPILFWTQDGGAGSMILGVREDLGRAAPLFERTVYGVGYVGRRVESVLVIGLGGGPDVLGALHHGAARVLGAEINRTAIELLQGRSLQELTGGAFLRPEVEIRHVDGRSLLRQLDERFDLIQLSGVDTKSTLASGSLSVSQNMLYTVQAFDEMLDRLAPGGRLVVMRLTGFGVRRTSALAIEALRRRGITRPERHLAVVGQGTWRPLLVQLEPWSAGQLEALDLWIDADGGAAPEIVIPPFDWMGVTLREPLRWIYAPPPIGVQEDDFFEALAGGHLPEFIAGQPVDLSPPTDDRPFFFFEGRPADALRQPHPTLARLYGIGTRLAAVSALLAIVPLLSLGRRGTRAPAGGRASALAYFACLGAAFMAVEIALMQQLVLLLGHQSYAISVVLFGLLVGSGAGSALSTRLRGAGARGLAQALVPLLIALLAAAVGAGPLFELAAGWPFVARLGLALALLGVLGIPMGVPFPYALARLAPALGAWGIGVNGFTSVLAATLAVPFSMVLGVRALLLLGLVLYGLAWACAPRRAPAA